MGTPHPAAKCLQALIDAEEFVSLVISQPDQKKGRGQRLLPSPVKELALKNSLSVETPAKIKDSNIINKIKQINPDLIVVVAYGEILPKELLNIPKHGAINVHASLLPKYRGASPIQYALLNGETETGITIMQIDEGLDTGVIIIQEKILIDPEDNAKTLTDKLFETGSLLLIKAINQIKEGSAKKIPQDNSKASNTTLITKDMGKIDWARSANENNNKIRAFFPWPSAYTYYKGKLLKILDAEVYPIAQKTAPGKIIQAKENFIVACGDNALLIKKLQVEGHKAIDAKEFLNGFHLQTGETLPN